MRSISWNPDAWNDYIYWQDEDKKTRKRINLLLKDIQRNGNVGIGKPEPLKGDYSGLWSREIDEKNRLIYHVTDTEVEIAECRFHYGNR